MSEYVLGICDHEFARLGLQQRVWSAATHDFLDACEIPAGGRVLDVGCGPGYVTEELARRVGAGGEVAALDESARWIEHVDALDLPGVRTICASVQSAELEPDHYDLVFLRWVLAFVPDPEEVLARLARCLRPGGAIAVMDYNHEGVSLFPRSPGFDAAIRATRELYASRGGDAWRMGHIQRMFRSAGLEPSVLRPYVQTGGPDSDVFRWADAFFPFHVEGMTEAGLMTAAERDAFTVEWAERKADPNTLFFSPYIVGAAARRTAP